MECYQCAVKVCADRRSRTVYHSTFSSAAEEFFIAHWNVENLFDTVDDPDVSGDEEFTPDGPKHSDDKRLETKLDNLSKIICKMNDGHGPDLGLCKVENRKVVEMLVAKLGSLGRDYQIVLKIPQRLRGIDCTARLRRQSVYSSTDSKFHHVDAGNTRDIVEAKLENGGVPLYVFVDHWPAQTHDEDQRSRRRRAAERLDEILAADPKADAVAIGDFNDDPDSVALKDHLHAVDSSDNMPAGAVFDTLAPVHAAGKGTFVWDDKWAIARSHHSVAGHAR